MIASKLLVTHCWGITYTHQGVVGSLNRNGFTYKQTRGIPCKVGSEKREKLLQQLDTLFKQTLDIESVVYFSDDVHPTDNSPIL